MEPPSRLEFSNSSGGWVDCSASGSPQPTIDWLSIDGTSIGDVGGIRRVLRNGTLVLLPFPAAAYRQDIHSTIYRCVANNRVGRIISRDVQVRAVVAQSYKVDVELLAASRGCTAILRCVLPSFVKDLVRVVSWVQEPSFFIYPSLQGDGKYHLLPSGELLIHNLDNSDRFASYRCRTMHKLTRHVVISNSAKIRLNGLYCDHRGIISPSIVEHSAVVSVSQDEGAVLLCVAQGCPSVEYRWYTNNGPEPMPVISGPRIRLLGPVLAIEAVTLEDAGTYKCSASNSGGEASAELKLSVSTPIQVEISPNVLSVNMGGTTEFRCIVTSNGIPVTAQQITWFKDGRQLPTSGRNGDTLLLSSVGREDKGMYQCVVRRQEGDTFQASAELQLGDAPPVLMYSFIEQTLQPGPPVSLKCSATGNPTPEVTWELDGFPLPSNGRFMIGQYVTPHGDVIAHVNITHVMVEDGGEYACIVENRAGKTSHSAKLNVYGLPYIRLIPKVTAVAGETLHLKCPVAGYPIEEIHWERSGRELPEDIRQKVQTDGTLMIHPVQKKDDSGVYTCWARNKQGQSARRSGEVNVIVPPKINPFHSSTILLNVGDRASITCSIIKGDTPLSVKWLKNGIFIDPSQRISITQVDQYNSILVIEHLSASHSGNYSCVVSNPAAEVESTQALLVNVIQPFSFQDGLAEGMRTRTICGVSRGDPPLQLNWLKDGQTLMPALGANVSSLDPFTSILSITSLSHSHSGEYTCVASNQASEVKHTALLQVKGNVVPPRWKIEPKDVNVERNQHVTLNCQADGVPIPTIIWKKATGSKSGDYEEIREKPYTKLLSNGSLLLQHVKEDREGFYICTANNGIGTGIGKVIQLKVNSPPYFATPSRMVNVKKGDTAVLQCEVNGDKPINIVWLLGGKYEINPSTNYRVSIKQDATPEGISAEVQINHVESSDSGQYFCQASNLYGRDQQLVQLQVQEPPQPPSLLETSIVSSRSISIKWQPRGGDAAEVTKYIVEYREIARQWQYLEISDPPQYTAVIDNLKPATKYAFRVIAAGPAGKSIPSQELIIKTEPQRPTGTPLSLSARPISSTEILINWLPPLFELRHGEIQGYNIGYKMTTAQSNVYNFSSTSGDGEEGTGEMILAGLSKYTRYTIVAQAFNQIGLGPLSEPVSAQTMEDVPSKPPNDLRCVALTSTSLQVSWQPPPVNHQNGLLLGYKISSEPMADISENDDMDTRKTTALTIVLTSLKKFCNYSVQVLAYSRMGDGVISQPIFCHTEEDAPEAPSDIKVVVSSSNSLYISWLEPKDPNGIITKYNLYSRQVNGREEMNNDKRVLPSQQTYFEATGLQAHTEYQFWITASTRVGEGKSSRVASQIISNRVAARIISFGGPIIRPWKTSASLHCLAVGKPRREWFKNDVPLKSIVFYNGQVQDSGELFIANLQVSDSGNFTCQVENGIGSDRVTYSVIVQVPPSPPVLYVTSATATSILMHWKNSANGNAPIVAYTLHFKRSHGSIEEKHLSRHASSHELKDLKCGSTYNIYLTSHNKIGSSLPSTTLHVKTQGQAPGIPIPQQLIFPNSSSVLLRLNAWPDNGCPILYFVLQYRIISDDGEDQWTLVSNALKPQRRFTISSLKPSTLYQLKIEAHNVAGSTTQDFTFVTLTIHGDSPPIDIEQRRNRSKYSLSDPRIIISVIILVTVIICLSAIFIVCFKYRQRKKHRKEAEDTLKKAEIQRDRYYATIHKVSLHGDKIPESSEDISPYATFQLSEASTLAQPQHPGTANTLLHSFMYHERAMTEGCASQPPQVLRSLHSQSPYYNITSKGKRRHSRKDPDSEESESDPDQLTSSRTESSNQLETKLKHRTVPSKGIIYHGAQSSTSSDLSPPMSDAQKSISRRGRTRYHLHHINTNTTPRHNKTKTTLNSPLSSPRNSCSIFSSNSSQIVANSNQNSMPSSQFRPIHNTRTINLTKIIPN
ncbi:CLUMA_CG013539, isoform A [Clunio marinus]|uniref:CLUMA_CG013539, isoform A n=1 Tax=Clunio marinus TaxID=568069 RepID=A0A1J1IKH4_9DIPT|nr:CLUMA_CG013539, isoform A [Clunio marinus]